MKTSPWIMARSSLKCPFDKIKISSLYAHLIRVLHKSGMEMEQELLKGSTRGNVGPFLYEVLNFSISEMEH